MGRFTIKFQTPYSRNGEAEHPGNARAWLWLTNYPLGDKPIVELTADCVSIGELEANIEECKSELEKMKSQARKKFKEHDRREALWMDRKKHRRIADASA